MRSARLKLILISNSVVMARAASSIGIDEIMLDLETRGKAERQAGRDTHLSTHELGDVEGLATALRRSSTDLLVRIDPWGPHSVDQLEAVLVHEPATVMLPMFTTPDEVAEFVAAVRNRARTNLLVETAAAVQGIEAILSVPGVDEIHIGLNDLHIDSGKRFMFEHLVDGSVTGVFEAAARRDIPCGVGGIARIGEGALRSELILAEHVRLGSNAVILSRTFARGLANASESPTAEQLAVIASEVVKLREAERALHRRSDAEMQADHDELRAAIHEIAHGVGAADRP